MFLSSILLAGLASTPTLAQSPGTFEQVGNTLVSAMMVFLGTTDKVYILDKTEGNEVQVNGHPAWASVWDIASRTATVMDVETNPFCAAGMHLPNGSWATFGGNGAITKGGAIGSDANPGGASASFDSTYQDYDGTRAIRIISPCNGDVSECEWYDSPNGLQMQKHRWYPGAEPLADGSVVLVGGFVNGGYINRNYPNTDPEYEGGAAEPTYEFYPSKGDAEVMQFMITTSGLNSYAHTYLMPSGKMLVQANWSTILWDYTNNVETALPDMPGKVVRVYPASGAVAMLPLTPENNYTPTVLFCGGSDMPEEDWGDYSWPAINTWDYPASSDCQRLTPEPEDGSSPEYEQDDDLPIGRTMGQFIALPDGTYLILNGAENGTAGYATQTGATNSYSEMPFGMSLSTGPVLQPALYNPYAPKGSRWSTAGFSSSTLPRLYHSTAILLPDGSVFVAGSNPNVDVNTSTTYPTTYTAEIFYPSYFRSSTRPQPQGVPTSLSYGGNYFDITVDSSSYAGSANSAAANSSIWLIRPGFSTHAMNMGQRAMKLNSTYSVDTNGTITYHVSQLPPNANLFQPGPTLFFLTINGIPSNGTMVLVGSGEFGTQPTSDAAELPANSSAPQDSSGSGSSTSNSSDSSSGSLRVDPVNIGVSAVYGAVVLASIALGMLGL